MIVLKPQFLIEMYDRFIVSQKAEDYLYKHREAFRAFNPERYRGIFRECLFAYPSLKSAEIEYFQEKSNIFDVPLGKSDARARYRFRELIGKPEDEYSPLSVIAYDLLENLVDAKDLHSSVDDPEKWEIIHVFRGDSQCSEDTLGFDIGYWGGNHFSLIGDTIVTPLFHSPPSEEFHQLASSFSRLNEHLLFRSVGDADTFRRYYKSKSWAEKEFAEGEFCIIRVDEA